MDAAVPRLAELARGNSPCHVVIALLNAAGDAFLALPLIRFVVELLGREHVSVWANAYHGRTVYSELGDVFLPSGETNRNTAAGRKEIELEAC